MILRNGSFPYPLFEVQFNSAKFPVWVKSGSDTFCGDSHHRMYTAKMELVYGSKEPQPGFHGFSHGLKTVHRAVFCLGFAGAGLSSPIIAKIKETPEWVLNPTSGKNDQCQQSSGLPPLIVGFSHALKNSPPDCFLPRLRRCRPFESHYRHK